MFSMFISAIIFTQYSNVLLKFSFFSDPPCPGSFAQGDGFWSMFSFQYWEDHFQYFEDYFQCCKIILNIEKFYFQYYEDDLRYHEHLFWYCKDYLDYFQNLFWYCEDNAQYYEDLFSILFVWVILTIVNIFFQYCEYYS